MIEGLKSWIVTICTTVFFITAVEMILPNGSLKKYAKFVLGLILISVLIKPFVKIFDKNYDINAYASNAEKFFENQNYSSNYEKLIDKNTDDTLKAFELNLKTVCENKLKEKFPQNNYVVDVKAEYIEQNSTFEIKSVSIGMKSGKIQNVKKVKIGLNSNTSDNGEINNNQYGNPIKDYICEELGISKDIITVYEIN